MFLYSFMYIQVKLSKSSEKSRWHIKIVTCFLEMCTSCLGWIDLCWVSVNVAVLCLHCSHSPAPTSWGLNQFLCLLWTVDCLILPVCWTPVFCFVLFSHVDKFSCNTVSPHELCNKITSGKKWMLSVFSLSSIIIHYFWVLNKGLVVAFL